MKIPKELKSAFAIDTYLKYGESNRGKDIKLSDIELKLAYSLAREKYPQTVFRIKKQRLSRDPFPVWRCSLEIMDISDFEKDGNTAIAPIKTYYFWGIVDGELSKKLATEEFKRMMKSEFNRMLEVIQ